MNKRGSRLDRFLSEATGLSRRLAQQVIRRGEVSVDGVSCRDPSMHFAAEAHIEFQGQPVTAIPQQYWMLYKPAGVVCAARDSIHRTVLEFVNVPAHVVLHVAGRLDVDATGLVLLTDNGEWSHRITSPRHKVGKVYRITLAEPMNQAGRDKLLNGVSLEGEPKPCRPARLERFSDNEWRVTITEGRYHQVKRMFAAIGNQVVALHRERIGMIVLDPALAPGESRPLTADEVASLHRGTSTAT